MDQYRNRAKALSVGQLAAFLQRLAASSLLHKALSGAGYAAIGYLFSTATLFQGAMPLGLAFGAAACNCAGGVFGFLGAFLGYALQGAQSLRYCASLLVCATCALTFTRSAADRSRLFMPFCVFLSLFCTGSAALFSAFSWRGFLLLVCEVTLCSCFVYFYELALFPSSQKAYLKLRLAGYAAFLLSFLLAFYDVSLLGVFSPSRAGALFAVMLLAYYGDAGTGAAAGVAFGAALDLSGGMRPYFAGIYGFAGLLSGMCRARSKLFFSVCFVLSNGLAILWGMEDPRVVASLLECFFASCVFVLIPEPWFRSLSACFEEPSAQPAVSLHKKVAGSAGDRLRQAAEAIEALSLSLNDFGDRLSGGHEAENISSVFHKASDKVCRSCPICAACWDRDYVTTFGAMNDVTASLKKKQRLASADFPSYFAARCINIVPFTAAVNDEYAALLRKKRSHGQSHAMKSLMKRQYEGMRGVLQDMELGMMDPPEVYPALQARAQSVAAAYYRRPAVSLYVESGRMHCEIRVGNRSDLPEDPEAFVKSLSLAMGRAFLSPEPVLSGRGILLRCSQREAYQIDSYILSRRKNGEERSGDSVLRAALEDGRDLIMLSDGMGTGEEAARQSTDALHLIEHFAKAGCGLAESASAVIPTLAVKLEERGFVTLDLLEINRFTGNLHLTKYGAAPSYLISGGACSCFKSHALPAGLAPEETPKTEDFTLPESGIFLMLSDGAADALTPSWLRETYRLHASPREFAAALLDCAEKNGGAADDRTVIVVSFCKNPTV